MDNKKYEQLINLIINEDEEQARELFHEIVVEKSREIYESIMEEEMVDEGDMGDDMGDEMGGQVGDLLDEINAEESGVTEEEEEEVFDLDSEEDEDMGGDEGEASEEVEDAVIRIEDKLDQLMAEFEEIMGGGDADLDAGDEGEEVEVDSEEEEAMMEAVQLQKVSVTHGDDGVQKKSPVAANSGKAGMDSKPVNFGGADEKGRTAPSVKDVEGASKFKNAPGHKSQDLSNAPKPVTKDGAAYDKSPVAK